MPEEVEEGTLWDKVRNVDIRLRLGQVAVVLTVEKKQTEWLKKLDETTEDRLVKKVFVEDVPRKRLRGRLRKSWSDDLKHEQNN